MKKLILGFFILICQNSFAETLKGVAKNTSGQVVYNEIHEIQRNENKETKSITTTYFNKEGQKIALMESDFNLNLYVPNITFSDYRFKRTFKGVLTGNIYQITETNEDKVVKTTKLDVKENTVAGPGFDNFIFNQLVEKKKQKLQIMFLVLTRHATYTFTSAIEDGDELDLYTIQPSNFFLKVFVDKIKISYLKNQKVLKSYEGISNLASDDDKSQNVKIEYTL